MQRENTEMTEITEITEKDRKEPKTFRYFRHFRHFRILCLLSHIANLMPLASRSGYCHGLPIFIRFQKKNTGPPAAMINAPIRAFFQSATKVFTTIPRPAITNRSGVIG